MYEVKVILTYPLVNIYIARENHHFEWETLLYMAMFNSYLSHYQRAKKIPHLLYM